MPAIPLAVETAVSRSPQLQNTRLVNFFTERQTKDAKGQAPLFSAPGITTLATAGFGPIRGMWNFNGMAYVVSGPSLYRIGRGGAVTLLGTGIGGTGPVEMSDNGVQMGMVNGLNGWMYTLASGAFVQVTSPAFMPARTIDFMDGYFIFDAFGTNEWFLSGLYDGLAYDALDFANAEAQPGFVVATAQNLQLLFIFCSAHIELWYDAGTENFPFQRYAGGIINYGTVSPYAISKQDGALFFLGVDGIFYRLQANVPIRVSTHPIETLIAEETNLAACTTLTYTWEGHKMIALTLPTVNVTLVFDISTGKWHERESFTAGNISYGRWRAACALEVYDKVLIGDSLSGQVGFIDSTVYTEFGMPMLGLIQSANVHHDRKRVFVGRFELDIQFGGGLTSGQGSDPQIMLQRSIDGGMTWGKLQPWRSMGKQGEYLRRARWLRQGQGRQMMWRLSFSDPIPRTVIQAYADITPGM